MTGNCENSGSGRDVSFFGNIYPFFGKEVFEK